MLFASAVPFGHVRVSVLRGTSPVCPCCCRRHPFRAKWEHNAIPSLAAQAVRLQIQSQGAQISVPPSLPSALSETGMEQYNFQVTKRQGWWLCLELLHPSVFLKRVPVPPHTNGVPKLPNTPLVLNALFLLQVKTVCSRGTKVGSAQA